MATTHTEIYRRLQGELRPDRLRFWPVYRSRVRAAQKKKLPLLLLYAPPAISGIIFSFVVYAKFAIESGSGGPGGGVPAGASVAAGLAGSLIQVHEQIAIFIRVIQPFALLVIAWYGAGLIAEDRKAGAHLLYFSRPMTRLDYFLGNLATVFLFGLRAVLLPVLLICTVAVFSSPDYAFLREKWGVILAAAGFSLLFVLTLSLVVLAASSLASRKVFALAGIFGLIIGSQAVATVLWELQRDPSFNRVSLWGNLERLADWMLGAHASRFDWDPLHSLAILGGVCALSGLVIAWRLRRLEVVQ